MKKILHLDYSSHYPSIFVEVTEEEYQHILKVQGNKYLSDTDEGRALLKELAGRPHIEIDSVIAYI